VDGDGKVGAGRVPVVVAHRGGAAMHAENSMRAFRAALALGVEEIEFDVHPARDGGIVVIHDPRFDETTWASGAIADRDSTELAGILLRDCGEPVPLLETLFDAVAATPVRLRMEIKLDVERRPYPGFAPLLMAAIERRGLKDRVVACAFELDSLQPFAAAGYAACLWYSKRARPQGAGFEEAVAQASAAGVREVGVYGSELGRERIDLLRRMQLGVGVWTVNGPARLDYWLRAPVDFLLTDQPDQALRIRAGLMQPAPAGSGSSR